MAENTFPFRRTTDPLRLTVKPSPEKFDVPAKDIGYIKERLPKN